MVYGSRVDGVAADVVGGVVYRDALGQQADGCKSQTDSFFRVIKDESRNALTAMQQSEDRDLQETYDGARFAATVGADHILRQHLSLIAVDINQGGATGQSVTPPPTPVVPPNTGVDCIAAGAPAPSSLADKMRVLSCLVFDTPHQFWVVQSIKTKSNNDLEESGRYDWDGFSYGPDWRCTDPRQVNGLNLITPQGPKPSCVKHDVAYASLQDFVDDPPGKSDKTLDTSWNPRNKHLADAKFHSDILKYGCQASNLSLRDIVWCNDKKSLADYMHYGVNKLNNKRWPVTKHDIIDAEGSQAFEVCAVPTLSNIELSPHQDRSVRVSWSYSNGCVSNISVDYYRLCWSAEGTYYNHRTRRNVDDSKSDCTIHNATGGGTTITLPSTWTAWSSLTLNTIEIRPNDIDYGGPWGFETLLGNKALDGFPIFGGAYYPEQVVNKTVSNSN